MWFWCITQTSGKVFVDTTNAFKSYPTNLENENAQIKAYQKLCIEGIYNTDLLNTCMKRCNTKFTVWQNGCYFIWHAHIDGVQCEEINLYHIFCWNYLILCLYNINIMNVCMKKFYVKKKKKKTSFWQKTALWKNFSCLLLNMNFACA